MPVTRRAYEVVADQLQREIESGVLKPGDKLRTIEQLEKQYQVGRSTVREALGLLKAKGYIETVQGGGTYVATKSLTDFASSGSSWLASAKELDELLQVRKILEVGTISLAAQHRTQEDLRNLGQVVAQMRSSIGDEEISQLYDVHFHLSIAIATHNDLLKNLMDSLSQTMTRTMRDSRKLWLYRESESAAGLFDEHESMYFAIAEGNIESAAAIMQRHIERVEAAFHRS